MSKPNRILTGVLALNFLLKLFVAVRPLKFIDGLTIPDDAYLSLTIARNIAKGLGPLYGLDYTNGFQPLYVFLMVPVFKLFPHDALMSVHIALIILICFDTMALYFLYKFVSAFSKAAFTPLFISAAWIFNSYVIQTTLNGMETSISFFFVVTILYYFHRFRSVVKEKGDSKSAFLLGVLLGLAIFTRVDNVFLGLAIFLTLLLDYVKGRISFRVLVKVSVHGSLGVGLALLPWLVYSFAYTGEIFQISGKAVRFMSLANVEHSPTWSNWYWPMLSNAFDVVFEHNSICLGLIALLVAIVFGRRTITFRSVLAGFRIHNTALAFSVFLFIAYACYIFTPWFFVRYLFPLVLIVLLYLASLVDLHTAHIDGKRAKILLSTVLLTLLIGLNVSKADFRNLFFSKDTQTTGYMNLGNWANTNFKAGTIVGSSQTGALGYFADKLTVINLDGVVNRACFESLVDNRNMDYVKATGIEYIVGWPVNIQFIIRHSKNFNPDDLLLIKRIDSFKSWDRVWYVYRVNDRK